ncbi:hypothetical protein L1887_01112 [Cichorium endivia]|nr:hypothetical protein L1887_01112 [Cichorium endivia]
MVNHKGEMNLPKKSSMKIEYDVAMKRRNTPYSFVNSLGVPRMAVAGAKPEFFVPRMKDDVKENESLLLNEVKRERAILGLIGVGEVNESKSKSKVKELEKEKKDGKFGVDRAPVSYILATHQMEAGKMVMNCDLTKKSNDELFHRY